MQNIKNGVDLDAISSYVQTVKNDPAQGHVKFVAKSHWDGGTKSTISVDQFYANGQPAAPVGRSFKITCDEPTVLGGTDQGPGPGELLAAALCGCLTAGIATNAALFDTVLEGLEVEVAVEWDMLGLLGLDRSVPTSAKGLHYTVRLKGDDPEKLQRAKETLDRKSAILKTFENPIPITTSIEIG